MNENLRATVETTIAYELPAGEFKIDDRNLVAVNIYVSKCLDGCCTEVTGRFIDSDRKVAHEWDMLMDDPEGIEAEDKFMTDNGLMAAMYVSQQGQEILSDGINEVLLSIAIGMGREAAEPVMPEMANMGELLKALFGEAVVEEFDKIMNDEPQASESPVGRETISSEN